MKSIAFAALAAGAAAMPHERTSCRTAGQAVGSQFFMKEHSVYMESLKANISGLVLADSATGELSSIGCDICTFALKKGFSLGCSVGASVLSAICLDAEPLCEAAFEALCSVCEADCNVDCWSQWACSKVSLCPSVNCGNPPSPPSPTSGGNPPSPPTTGNPQPPTSGGSNPVPPTSGGSPTSAPPTSGGTAVSAKSTLAGRRQSRAAGKPAKLH